MKKKANKEVLASRMQLLLFICVIRDIRGIFSVGWFQAVRIRKGQLNRTSSEGICPSGERIA